MRHSLLWSHNITKWVEMVFQGQYTGNVTHYCFSVFSNWCLCFSGFSVSHIMVLILCVSASGSALLLCCLIYCRNQNGTHILIYCSSFGTWRLRGNREECRQYVFMMCEYQWFTVRLLSKRARLSHDQNDTTLTDQHAIKFIWRLYLKIENLFTDLKTITEKEMSVKWWNDQI